MPNDDGNENEPLDPKIREELKEARKLKSQLAEQETAFKELRKESALDKAKIPETGAGAFFRKHYDGELTTEAIVQAATEAGVLVAQGNESDADLEALRAASQASSAGGATSVEDAGAKFLREINAAKSPEEIMAIVAAAPPELGVSVPQN